MEENSPKSANASNRKYFFGCAGCGFVFLCAAGILIVAAGIWLFSGPDSGVKFNNEMDQYALDYLQENDILNSSEALIAYYDASLAMDSSEAAILTSERIVYHKNGRTVAIPLEDVTDIQHRYESFAGDIIEVTGRSGKIIKIEIAPLNQGEIFLDALVNAWNKVRKEEF